MNRYIIGITDYECAASQRGVTVYQNNTNTVREVFADEENFRHTKLMVFGPEGRLYEIGGDLLANKDGTNGSPQISVKIPSGGFLVSFGAKADPAIWRCFRAGMENAMLYNATMTAVFEMYGAVDSVNNNLTIYYDQPAAVPEDAKKYLFVGNSSTYFNGTPLKFKAMCAAAGIPVVVDYCTFGSAYLSEFADPAHERGKAFRNALRTKEYDYVIIQEASNAAKEDTENALSVMLPLIEKNGAEPVLYMRYASVSDDTMYEETKRHCVNYTELAHEFGLHCIPSALAFAECRDRYPAIPLYADDGSHHSAEASYMIACTWFYCLTGISPIGNGFDPHFDSETVRALQQCAVIVCRRGYNFGRSRAHKALLKNKKRLARVGLIGACVAILATAAAVAASLVGNGNEEE